MGAKNRKINSEIAISLFSFQDIITCLSGIMILLVLLIAVDISTETSSVQEKEYLNKAGSSTSIEKNKTEEAEKELIKSNLKLSKYQIKEKELKLKLEELKDEKKYLSNSHKSISFIPAKDADPNQKAILIECSNKYIKTELRTFYIDSNGIKEFVQSLENLNKLRDYPLFIIKPSASDYAMELIDFVQKMGFDVGYDAILEDESVQNIEQK